MNKLPKMPEEVLEMHVISLKGVWPDDYHERYFTFDKNYQDVYYGDFEKLCKEKGWHMLYKPYVATNTKLPKLLEKEKTVMNKYTYTQVEHISDLDITGNTQYYLYEEGVGHSEFRLEDMKGCSIYSFESMIKAKIIFTREEKPWFDRIPKHGILCKNTWSGKGYRLIISYDEEDFLVYDEDGNDYEAHSMKPLTNDEIKQFLQEEEE